MTKAQLTEVATSLNISVKGMNEPQMVQKLCTTSLIEEQYMLVRKMSTLSSHCRSHSPVHKTSYVQVDPIPDKTDNWQFQLEKMKMEMEEKRLQREMEEKRLHREMEEKRLQREMDEKRLLLKLEENHRIREHEKEMAKYRLNKSCASSNGSAT